MEKKKMGIIGGMGARAGMLLFKAIIEKSPATRDQDFMEVVLHSNSAIPDRTRAILYNESCPLPELLRSIRMLNDQQVDMVASACCTSYYYYEEMQRASNAPILHPIKLTVNHILKHAGKNAKVGVLATSGTVRMKLFQHALSKAGIDFILLPNQLQEEGFMKAVYMENGLKSATISREAKVHFESCLEYMKAQSVNFIIGGCTEVSIVADEYKADYPILNVLEIVADEAIRLGHQSTARELEEKALQIA